MVKPGIIILITVSSFSLGVTCSGQELAMVRDTTNHFEIGIPIGWRYGVPADRSLALIAIRQKQTDEDEPRENLNINILHRDETDLDATYHQFLESIGEAEGFRIIDQGEKVIENRKYKYLIETHKNMQNNEDMNNYVYFTNDNGTVLILTMVTTSKDFRQFKNLFDAVAESLRF